MKDGNINNNNFRIPDKNNLNMVLENPLVEINTDSDDEIKIELIEKNFREIMEVLGLNMDDKSLKGTPRRVAKMYVKELFAGLNIANKPSITLFKNEYNYDQMLVEKDITLFSMCEHHFVPIIGKAHIAYFSTGDVIGISKLNRIVQYFSKQPQLQEKLTMQIAQEVMSVLNTEDAAVLIEADHLCVKSRGVSDVNSKTVTSFYNGKFLNAEYRNDFLNYIKN